MRSGVGLCIVKLLAYAWIVNKWQLKISIHSWPDFTRPRHIVTRFLTCVILTLIYPKVPKSVNFSDSYTNQYYFDHDLPQSPQICQFLKFLYSSVLFRPRFTPKSQNLSIFHILILISIISITIYPKVLKSVNFSDSNTDQLWRGSVPGKTILLTRPHSLGIESPWI